MLVLTDCPRKAADLVQRPTWRRSAVADLEPGDATLWRALSDDAAVTVTEVDSSEWARLVIIEDAERSQLDALHDAIGGGLELAGPTACIALTGRGFRGQRDRTWATEAGNLFLVVGLPVAAPAAEILPALIALPAVALVDALGGGARIKWVNDILIDGAKVAGVLAMSHCVGVTLETAVLGLGVNVHHAPNLPPTPFVPAVTALTDSSLTEVLWRTLDALAQRRAQSPGELIEAYRRASCVIGRQVRIWDESANDRSGQPRHVGVVDAIGDDLTLRLDSGETVATGRLELLSTASDP